MLAPEGACLVISALWRVGQMKVDETQWCNMLLDFLSQLGVTDGISLVWRHIEGVLYHRSHGWCTNSVMLLSAVIWISVTVPEIINKMCRSVQLRTASMSPISPPPCTATRDDLNWFMLKLLDYSRSHALIWVSTLIWAFTNLNK